MKKVKIVSVSKRDAWYQDRKRIIGLVGKTSGFSRSYGKYFYGSFEADRQTAKKLDWDSTNRYFYFAGITFEEVK